MCILNIISIHFITFSFECHNLIFIIYKVNIISNNIVFDDAKVDRLNQSKFAKIKIDLSNFLFDFWL